MSLFYVSFKRHYPHLLGIYPQIFSAYFIAGMANRIVIRVGSRRAQMLDESITNRPLVYTCSARTSTVRRVLRMISAKPVIICEFGCLYTLMYQYSLDNLCH